MKLAASTLAFVAFLAAGPGARQTPPAQQRPAAPASAQATAGRQAQTPAWKYDPQGRRDPFISLRRGAPTGTSAQNRPAGLAGVAIGEVMIRGIVHDKARNEFIALAQAPDGRSFQLRRNARLFDGVVKQITIDAVVFTQEVNDPLSLVKQREVRKTMKTGDREEEL